MRYWPTTSGSQNRQMFSDLQTLRERSRDMARNLPWMASAEHSFASNIIANGIVPNPAGETEEIRKTLTKSWRRWCSTAETSGTLDFGLLQHLAARTLFTSGEVFIRIRPRRADDDLYLPFQLQVLDAEYVPLDKNEILADGNKVVMGVEFNKIGAIVAYWMHQEHPSDIVAIDTGTKLPVRVDARHVIHIFDQQRPEQVRGVPWMAPSIVRMNDVKDYEDAEVNRKKTAALYPGFVTSPELDETPLDEEEDDLEGGLFAVPEPGTMVKLGPGEDVTFNAPPDTGVTYDPHMKMQLRSVAMVADLTYEQITGDLSDVNFSSIRAGLNEMQRRAGRVQKMIIHQLCQRVWNRFLDEMVLSGRVKIKGYDTVDGRWDARDIRWIKPGWRYTDPEAEQAADASAVKNGFKSRAEIILDSGRDPIQVEEQIQEERERAKEKGLQFDVDAPPKTVADIEMAKISAEAKKASAGGVGATDRIAA
ncbi:MAG: phage portal protein [Rhodobiaceae bacterium]|nr:MAG: phage portal protein [Rhodobiaceae bacterium]